MNTIFDTKRYEFIFPEGRKVLYGDKELKIPEIEFRQIEDCPKENEHDDISVLWFMPTARQLNKNKSLPKFVKELSNLQVIQIPLDLLPIDSGYLPSCLKCILLSSFQDKKRIDQYNKYIWNENYVLNDLKYFSFLDFDGTYELANISSVNFPQLEWIECFIDEEGITLDKLRDFKSLNSIHLHYPRSFDIFSALKDLQISNMKLEGLSKGFPISNLSLFNKLEVLHINGLKDEFDCGILSQLPLLKEIVIFNSSKVINVKAMLELSNLENIWFMDCKNSFNKETKKQFKEKGFKLLDIDFA